MTTLRQLRYLAALSRHRHFGRAAEECAVTQPALSVQIQELEAGLRGPWFKDRDGLRAAFDAVMAAPALMEIDRRARAEYQLAALIADTVPRSIPVSMRKTIPPNRALTLPSACMV